MEALIACAPLVPIIARFGDWVFRRDGKWEELDG